MEYIVDFSGEGFNLYEYNEDREIVPICIDAYILDIVTILSNDENPFVWVEKTIHCSPLIRELKNRGIRYGFNNAAEDWMRYRWAYQLSPMRFASFWEVCKPIIYRELEFERKKLCEEIFDLL